MSRHAVDEMSTLPPEVSDLLKGAENALETFGIFIDAALWHTTQPMQYASVVTSLWHLRDRVRQLRQELDGEPRTEEGTPSP
jgi:hypothetical protein